MHPYPDLLPSLSLPPRLHARSPSSISTWKKPTQTNFAGWRPAQLFRPKWRDAEAEGVLAASVLSRSIPEMMPWRCPWSLVLFSTTRTKIPGTLRSCWAEIGRAAGVLKMRVCRRRIAHSPAGPEDSSTLQSCIVYISCGEPSLTGICRPDPLHSAGLKWTAQNHLRARK